MFLRIILSTVCVLAIPSALRAAEFTLVNNKIIKNAILIERTNNLVRLLHDDGDNTWELRYFTKDSQKQLESMPVDHAKRLELLKLEEEEKRKKLARLSSIKNDVAPPFPVEVYDLQYMGGNVASMTISNVLDEEVRVDIISGRIVQSTQILKPFKQKKRLMIRHQRGEKIIIKAKDEQKTFDVR